VAGESGMGEWMESGWRVESGGGIAESKLECDGEGNERSEGIKILTNKIVEEFWNVVSNLECIGLFHLHDVLSPLC